MSQIIEIKNRLNRKSLPETRLMDLTDPVKELPGGKNLRTFSCSSARFFVISWMKQRILIPMRHIIVLSAFVLLCSAAFAQQEKITGVTINPDNSVTFRYRNPKAVTVEVSGEFMEGAARLREVEGDVKNHTVHGDV